MFGIEIPKQRGIYSEILTTEDTENLKEVSTFGPSKDNLCTVNKKQAKPRALGIKRKAAAPPAEIPEEQNIMGKDYFRNPEVNEGFYSFKRAGVADVDPKVMEPFLPIPGKPPRKVVIDRQRKLFASLDIEELLLELGIDYTNPDPTPADWLPLEPFDDTEYDCREPSEWIAYGEQEDGSFYPIPGKGLCMTDGVGHWRPVLIHTYDEERHVYTGYWDSDNAEEMEYVEMTRINLLFNSEDPRIFAQRVAQAHSERIYADSQIRYNFFIDYMPVQELADLDTEQRTRILKMALASRELKGKQQVDTNGILFEVKLDFHRTMNKIIMEDTMSKPEEERLEMIPANLTLPPKPKAKEVPYFGQVPIPPHDFPEQFSTFCFNSLFIKDEVIRAMVQIREECNNVLKENHIFNVQLKKLYRLDEFKQQMNSSISTMKFNTCEQGWVSRLEKIIKASFKDVGKGWFNIHETSKETYEFGKLKKFLTLVNFMMQDTVLNMCKNSVHEFVEFMLHFIPDETFISSAAVVTNKFKRFEGMEIDEEDDNIPIGDDDLDGVKMTKEWCNKKFAKNNNPEPLFQLVLILKAKNLIPQYSNQPKDIVIKIKEVFEEGIRCLQEIPHLEPILLRHLFKTHIAKTIKTPVIPPEKPKVPDKSKKDALIDENTWLWEAFDKLIQNLERAIIPLEEYVKTYSAFEFENQLDPDKHVAELDEGDTPITPEELRHDIEVHKEKERRLLEKIPEFVYVSMFQVDCKDIRNMYAQKYQQIVEKEIRLIAQKAKDKNYDLTASFGQMEEKIKKPPTTIDELTDLKNFIKDCGPDIEKKKKEIDDCMKIYKILDEFNFEMGPVDMNCKWDLYGAPQKIVKLMEVRTGELEKMKEQMIKEMEVEQEDFEEMLDNLELTVGGFDENKKLEKYMDIASEVDNIDDKIKDCLEAAKTFNSREYLVGKETTDYSRLQKLSKSFQPYSNLWKTVRTWNNSHKSWMNDPWEELDAVALEDTFELVLKTINQVFRQFRDRKQDDMLEIATGIKAKVDEFKPTVPLAVALRKEGMKERHWDALSESVGFDIRPTDDFTLTSVVEKGMLTHIEKADEIGEKAYKEYHIEKSLAKMKSEWEGLNFMLPRFKQTPTFIIAGFEDAINLLDEHIVTTQAMQFSTFKKPFEDEIEQWCIDLMLCMETLEQWTNCQSQWTYLQPIFDSPDIMRQLPAETKKFKGVDIKWKYIMNQAKEKPGILLNCTTEGRKESFVEANRNLEVVQKGLNEYLEKKRSSFARFYFLSDDELLEILSQTKEVRNVRSHLRKVFEAVTDLEFKPDDTMHAMISGEGEKINFVRKVDPSGRNVEYWMGDVEKQMIASVRNVFELGINDYVTKDRNDWIICHAGQIVLDTSKCHWTSDVEKHLDEEGLPGITKYANYLQEQLNSTVMLVRQKLSKLDKISVNALIVIDVHALEVVKLMVDQKCQAKHDFEWVQQLRYYWLEDSNEMLNCFVRCVATDYPYGYEYLGNTGRLVITELTDKCYMTLMGALQLNLGGAPAGPAGTGKTESVKDLAKGLAKQCVVFNCSPDMTHTMCGTFFKGLAASGAWCCFDEFNRINIEVLSVIAQYLLQLFGAKGRNESEVVFEGSHIKMKPTFSVFITMNPGYAGRTELPDNLKALFRPVAMMVPDYAVIGEIMLYSFGFLQGKILAKKMVVTFTLSSEQLSSQDHYDYGMRAVRTVINAAGQLKNAYPDLDEDKLLLRALRDVNVPKFLKDDLPLFENIILDLFPGVERPEQTYGNLGQAIEATCKELNLQNVDKFNTKVIQLYDTIQVRHGLMIVGPTGGGKTSNYKCLQKAMSSLKGEGDYETVRVDILNPKSITMGQLYGFVDPGTLEWQNGIAAKLVADAAKDESPDKHWIMFDGPVDSLWIESMNTVLDDNKKLCLNSGQIIQLSDRMTMMFEVADLAVASPATVSRCGMVYMEPESMGLAPLVSSWLNTLPEKVSASKFIVMELQKLYDETIDDACYYARKNCPELVKSVDNNIAQSSMRLVDTFFSSYVDTETKKVLPEQIANLEKQIRQIFFFCIIWSVGATTNQIGRERFDKWLREMLKKYNVEFPEEKTIYDYNWDTTKLAWTDWLTTVPTYEVDIKISYAEIVVPTMDSIRMKYLAKQLIINGKNVLMPGPTGVGKSVYIQELCTYEMDESYQMLKICFSAQTGANQTQDFLDEKFEKRRQRMYGPPLGKKYIIFVDDLNMPKREEFGAQPPIELLRQKCDHGGWYDRKNKDKPFNRIVDIIFVSAMGPPGGGRAEVTDRLQRHYNFLTYTDIAFTAVTIIYKTIIDAFFFNYGSDVKKAVDTMIEAQLEVYDQVLNGPLKPIPSKSHYTFNLRDISKIFQGVVATNNKSVAHCLSLVRVWIHENKRVFGDRLNDAPDRKFLDDLLVDRAQVKFAMSKAEIFNSERIIFGDFMEGIDVDTRVYKQIEDLKGMQSKIEEYLDDYNGCVKTQMNLVMFLDACDHVARIQRILRQPLGNALLLGVGGSGRQSLARLATFIANYKIFQIEVIKGYSMGNWRDDIKVALMQAGVENKSTSFLFVDTQIIKEQQLEDINNILNGGDVPNLYKAEDKEPIYKVGKQLCIEKGMVISVMNMFQAYLGRVQTNIHLVIAMSPLGEVFRARLRQFPSLVTCCTLDWFNEWPEEALLGVGKGQILATDIDLGDDLDNCVEMFKVIHQSVENKSREFKEQLRRVNWVTPTSFLEQLNMYKDILVKKREQVLFAKNRLVTGLTVLDKAAVEIAALNKQIVEMQPVLEATKKLLEETIAQLNIEKEGAEKEREIVAKDEAEARTQEAEAAALKGEAEQQLAAATPLLEEATRVLKELKKDELYMIQAIKQPTPQVVNVMELSCLMFQHRPSKKHLGKFENDQHGFFELARLQLLSNPNGFLKSMLEYKKENIPEAVVRKVNAIVNAPDFSLDKIKQASEALLGITKWILAMMKYHELLKIVNPKRAKVAEMNAQLEVVRARLAEKMKMLRAVEEKMALLEATYQEKLENERALVAKIDDCNKKLSRANKIIAGLQDEKVRWSETVAKLTVEADFLVGNCLIAAGMVAYSGPFTSKFRGELEKEWGEKIKALGIKIAPNISMKEILEDPVQTKSWTAAGLPNDNLSIENGIIMFKSRRWPLMIDPQNQANKFIKSLSKDHDTCKNSLKYMKMSDGNMLKILELGIQNGTWIMLENVGEDLDPALEPVLQKQIAKDGTLRLGDKQIPFSRDFLFFMTTTLPNPHYAPETQVKVSLLNFAITPFGLEEQMLYLFVIQEMPELQRKKDLIVQQNAQAAKTLRDIEEKILHGLTKNEEISAILEDDELINVLDDSKVTSDEIKIRMKESIITEQDIDQTRETFRPVAFRAQVLFFTIVDLAVVNDMYQYSLQWFAGLFGSSVDNSAKSQDATQRIKNLNDHFTMSLYENVCRSLFEAHKLLFSFKMTINILFGKNAMDAEELRFLLAGPSGDIKLEKNPTDWLGDLEWDETCKQLVKMSELQHFKGFDKFFYSNHRKFQEIFDSNEPHNCPLPGEWNNKLNTFQKVIVLKSIRPDKLVLAIQNFVIEHMGKPFIESPVFNLAKSYKDSSITTPLIFVLATGSDPVADWVRFAEESNMSKKCESISLGRGQGSKAANMINENLNRGGWVLLMNCHLAVSWMPSLEAIVEQMDDTKHRDFRLWLTSSPNPYFPVSILQNSVKMTLEPPSGLKQNVLTTYDALTEEEFEGCTKPQSYKKLLFGLCFFHAIVQDRRKFGPIGWNIAYAFTNEDLAVSRRQLKIFVEDYEDVPYKVLNKIGAEINYGGRVTDYIDVRLIKTILIGYLNEDILKDGHPLSESGIYYSPPAGDKEDYLDYIKTLPLNPAPEAFGLHENAEISTNQINTTTILDNMMSMQSQVGSGTGKSFEEIVGEQAKFLQDKTPEVFDLEKVTKKYPTAYEESMNTVLFQECVRYNALLAAMKTGLVLVQKALVGELVMSEELELLARAIFDNKVAGKWCQPAAGNGGVGHLSMKPLASWIDDLVDRIKFLQDWYDNGTPATYWVSGFFFPQAFFTGTKQNYARSNVIAIDKLAFDYLVVDNLSQKDITEKPEAGCYIYGMYLEGCKWDYEAHSLTESDPKKLYSEFPMMHLVPVQDRVIPTTGIYNTPSYKVLSRAGTLSTTGHSTNYVMNTELPSVHPEDKWIRAGVALFLALKY